LYGRRADERNSVHRYLLHALRDRRVSVSATGDEVREYIHVADAARASLEVLDDGFRNEHVVLSGQHPLRFRELLEIIREIVGSDVEIELRPPNAEAGERGVVGHYGRTPYTFRPRIARKLVLRSYLEMGQGLVDCLDEIHERLPRP
jgi:UDP-glucose 4-epimerase